VTEYSVTVADQPKPGCRSVVGKLVGTVFFLLFFGMGCLFVFFIMREVALDAATYRWQRTPAVVIESEIVDSGDDENPYRLAVNYRYSYNGVEYIGDRVARSHQGEDDYSDVQREALSYAEGAEVDCYVNPERPGEAVLERRPPWFAFMILLPLIFVAIGAIGMYAVWSRGKPKRETVSISEKAKGGRHAHLIPIILGALFTVIGGGLFVTIGVLPAVKLMRAASWEEVPCRVVSSTVRSHSSDDGTTYSVDILYEYEFGGHVRRSNRYDFANFSSSGHEGKREIVDRYPAGAGTVCFVDPADPVDAVLSREFRLAYLIGLFPLIFLIVGLAVLSWGIKSRRSSTQSPTRGRADQVDLAPVAGPAVLTTRHSRIGKVVGSMIFTLIWNGIVSVFVYKLISDWQRGHPDWFLALFLIPFVLVGLGSIVMIGYFVLAAFNPRPRLELEPSIARLGESIRVTWRFDGRSERIQHLRITLEGREEATYRRGTDTCTDTETFARFSFADTEVSYEISQGYGELQIPEDTIHSLDAGNNKIVWSIKINGDIPRWPDVDDEFEVRMLPLTPEVGSR